MVEILNLMKVIDYNIEVGIKGYGWCKCENEGAARFLSGM